jgi:small-conductance mechanosensitive channel
VAVNLMRLAVVAGALVVTLAVITVVHRILLRTGRRFWVARELANRSHRPLQLLAISYLLDVGLRSSGLTVSWRGAVVHVLDLVSIAAGAWLFTGLLFVIEDVALARFRTDVEDNQQARTVHTQIQVIRRITAVSVAVFAIGAMLMTFHEARIIGTSLLASAGVAAAIAAFAANTLLSNLIAGLQLAFGKSLRLDDVVVINDEWGRIEDITLTYIVLHIWDDRRLILPTSWFTSHPFENWTRTQASLLGAVEFDLDWSVPVERMRDELRAVLSDTEMWDGRVSVLQVTDAVNGYVHLRALVSAANAPTLWDLRCLVRERLVGWLREHHPEALPKVRAEVGAEVRDLPAELRPTRDGRAPAPRTEVDARVFGGDAQGLRRARDFTGPIPGLQRARGRASVDEVMSAPPTELTTPVSPPEE